MQGQHPEQCLGGRSGGASHQTTPLHLARKPGKRPLESRAERLDIRVPGPEDPLLSQAEATRQRAAMVVIPIVVCLMGLSSLARSSPGRRKLRGTSRRASPFTSDRAQEGGFGLPGSDPVFFRSFWRGDAALDRPRHGDGHRDVGGRGRQLG